MAKVEQNGPRTLVDLNKIRQSLEKNGFGIISGMEGIDEGTGGNKGESNQNNRNGKNMSISKTNSEEVVRRHKKKINIFSYVF